LSEEIFILSEYFVDIAAVIIIDLFIPISKDEPLKQWTKDCREEYLDELTRSEGCGTFTQ
jgi:hypothetical protein